MCKLIAQAASLKLTSRWAHELQKYLLQTNWFSLHMKIHTFRDALEPIYRWIGAWEYGHMIQFIRLTLIQNHWHCPIIIIVRLAHLSHFTISIPYYFAHNLTRKHLVLTPFFARRPTSSSIYNDNRSNSLWRSFAHHNQIYCVLLLLIVHKECE